MDHNRTLFQPADKDFSPIESINRPGMGQKLTFDNSDLRIFMVRINLEANPEELINLEEEIQKKSIVVSSFYNRLSNVISQLTIQLPKNSRGLVFIKVLLPHVLAWIFSLFYILMQEKIEELCFCMPNCNCSKGFWVRFYTFFRSFFTKWVNILILGVYFTNLVINSAWAAGFEILWCVLGVGGIYILFDGNACQAPVLESSLFGMSGLSFVYSYAMIKKKINLKSFYQKSYLHLQIIYGVGLTLNRTLIGVIFPRLFDQINQFKIAQTYADLEYLCFVIIYTVIFKKLVFLWMYKFYKCLEELKYEDITPIIIMIRFYICYMISLQISNLMNRKLSDISSWIYFVYYAFFQFCFYTHSNPFSRFFYFVLSKIKKKKKSTPKDDSQFFFENLIAGYMIEFQLILIPRLLILMFWKRWITSDFGIFYKSCKMEINEKFWVMDESMILFLVAFNFTLPICILLWIMYRKCNSFFDYKVEKKNVILRTVVIFGIHGFFEGTLQDYEVMKISGKGLFDLCSK